MGPAYLLDVVGIDTAHHAQAVMAAGFPDRMSKDYRDAIDVMFDNQRFGQKISWASTAIARTAKASRARTTTSRPMRCWPK